MILQKMMPAGTQDPEGRGRKRGRQMAGFMIKRFLSFTFWGSYQIFPSRSPGWGRGEVNFLPEPLGRVFLPIRLF
jgi:hypothetical protein